MTRVLVISDIHANFEALRRVPDRFDRILCLGDIVDYGPDPVSCIQWLRDRDVVVVRGNHDDALARGVDCRCNPWMHEASSVTRALMAKLLGPADRQYLGTLPVQEDVTIDGVRIHLVHATPSDPLYSYVPPDDEERWAREAERAEADVLLVGHTHLPMSLRVGGGYVVNPGSVGQPRDGDPRASFAIIEDGQPRLERVAYDIDASVSALEAQSLPDSVFRQLASLLRTGVSA
jgi:putative phosphoesterase